VGLGIRLETQKTGAGINALHSWDFTGVKGSNNYNLGNVSWGYVQILMEMSFHVQLHIFLRYRKFHFGMVVVIPCQPSSQGAGQGSMKWANPIIQAAL
jgi:hypothetical protein